MHMLPLLACAVGTPGPKACSLQAAGLKAPQKQDGPCPASKKEELSTFGSQSACAGWPCIHKLRAGGLFMCLNSSWFMAICVSRHT